jgi:hypothetical protein
MASVRVFELARELNLKTKTVLDICKDLDYPVKNHMSKLDERIVCKIKKIVSNDNFRLTNIKPSYLDDFGDRIEVTISNHALKRVKERWNLLHPRAKLPDDLYRFIALRFSNAKKVENLSKQEKLRIQRYGETLFFRQNNFTFVVQDSVIVTIEISDKGKRELNAKTNQTLERDSAGNAAF